MRRLKKDIGKEKQLGLVEKGMAKMAPPRSCEEQYIVAKTATGKEIFVCRGKKSAKDFVVKFRLPGTRMRGRAPTHAHLLSELHIAAAVNEPMARELRAYLLSVFKKLRPLERYPPRIVFVQEKDVQRFKALDRIRDFDVEFLLKLFELIMLQEKTNYPEGSLTRELLEGFLTEPRVMNFFKSTFRGK